jgi:hypothetical protein
MSFKRWNWQTPSKPVCPLRQAYRGAPIDRDTVEKDLKEAYSTLARFLCMQEGGRYVDPACLRELVAYVHGDESLWPLLGEARKDVLLLLALDDSSRGSHVFVRDEPFLLDPMPFRHVYVFEIGKGSVFLEPVGGIPIANFLECATPTGRGRGTSAPVTRDPSAGTMSISRTALARAYLFPRDGGEYACERCKMAGEDAEKRCRHKLNLASELALVSERRAETQYPLDLFLDPTEVRGNYDQDQLVEMIERRITSLFALRDILVEESSPDLRDLYFCRERGALYKAGEDRAAFDSTSHRMAWLFGVCATDDASLRKWFAEAEAEVIVARLRLFYNDEESVMRILRDNSVFSRCGLEEIEMGDDTESKAVSEKLFRANFPSSALPSRWFSCHIDDSASALGSRSCVVVAGCVILSYEHLRRFYLPDQVRKALSRQCSDEYVESYHREHMERLLDPSRRDDVENKMMSETLRVFGAVRDRQKEKQQLRDARKRPAFQSGSVPDIEDLLSRRRALPLCMRRLVDHLHAEKHIYHHERTFMFAPYLREMGHTNEAMEDYLFSIFSKDPKRSIDRDAFNKEYAWDLGGGPTSARQKEYTPSCPGHITKMSERNRPNNETHGCPFVYLDRVDLGAALSMESDVPEAAVEKIVSLACTGPNTAVDRAKSACRAFFDVTNEPFEGDMWNSPPWYTRWSMGARSRRTDLGKAPRRP